MIGNVNVERLAIESTYEDVCTVKRSIPTEDSNGIAKLQITEVYADIICALSGGGDSSKQTEVQQSIRYDMTLFVEPDKIINPGDTAIVKRLARVHPSSTLIQTFEVIGHSLMYATHQQVRLKVADLA